MKTDQQSLAHDLYFQTNKTQQEIADILGVHRHTVRLWIKKNRWDEMKAAARQMPSLILQSVYTHFNAVNDKIFSRDEADRCPTMQEVSMLHKLLTMTKSIEKKHTGAYLEAFQELQLFLFNRDEKLAMQLREHIADYARGTLGDKEFMARKKRKNNVLEVVANLGREELRAQKEENNVNSTCHPEPAEGEQECTENVTFCNNATPAAQHISNHVETQNCESPLARNNVQTMDQKSTENVQFCIEKVQPATTSSNTSKAFTVAANGKITAPQDSEKSCTKSNSETCHPELAEGVTFSHEGQAIPGTQHNSSPLGVGGVMALPPHMRPSPFIVGDTVWILHPDHLDSRLDTCGNPWGPIKMNYTIRYYPDIDPATTKAA